MTELFATSEEPRSTESHTFTTQDTLFMQHALMLAEKAAQLGEVPVGAVLVVDNEIIGEGYNQPITTSDPTAHAEMVALRNACVSLKNYRLPPTACLYVTLEPCTMCIGGLIHARLPRLIYGACEPRAGAVISTQDLSSQDHYNHRIAHAGGLCAEQSSQLLKSFFKARRKKSQST